VTAAWTADNFVLRAEHLARSVHDKVLVEDANFAVGSGEVIAGVGPTGAASGITSLVITLLIRGRLFTAAEQLILQPGRG
jgi:ABC-type lipopolysaccharide export system ATPase subunit